MQSTSIQWAIHALTDHRYEILSPPEQVLQTAWSHVYRFKTNQGIFYLKKVPALLFLEAKIIRILSSQFQAPVPLIFAENQDEHCLLMHDAGMLIHDFFQQNGFQDDALIKLMHQYSNMQIKTADKIPLFLNDGVPDWRTSELPELYRQLMVEEELLLGDGLSPEEVNKLQKLDVELMKLCDQLSIFSVPETLSHCDFHDKNILIDPQTKKTTIIDLGEVTISHPFFSLNNCLHMVCERFRLTEAHHRKLQKACLQPWLCFESEESLLEILSLIQKSWSIHAALGEYRLANSVDPVAYESMRREGRFAMKLRYWHEQF